MPFLKQINIYPVKSCQGISLQHAELAATGLKYDRHWMLVDENGEFLSQRSHPILAQVATRLSDTSLLLKYPDEDALEIGLDQTNQRSVDVSIWNDRVMAQQVSERANLWFSHLLQQPCRLVFLPDDIQRHVDQKFARAGETVGFADGFPLLLISQASVDLLSQKMGRTIASNRFRANLVVEGCDAHAEDEWSSITIGEIRIDLVKPCSRCIIPSIDQSSGEKMPLILKTLADYRKRDHQVLFGHNAIHRSTGWLQSGQPITIQSSS